MARITISEDYSQDRGWALLSIRPPIGSQPAPLSIMRRQSDKPYLGPQGWQAKPYELDARSIVETEDATVLQFGPEVVDEILVDQQVTIAIKRAGITEDHAWPDIAPSARRASGNVGAAPVAPETTVSVAPPPKPPVKPPEPKPVEPPVTLIGDPVVVEPKPGRRRWLIPALAVLLVLLAAAAILYYLLGRPQEETPPPPVTPPAETGLPDPEPLTLTLSERYHELREAGEHAEDLLALAAEALAEGDVDTGFLATTLSADRGSAAAQLQLGAWYDPATEDSVTTPNPDVAARYYSAAVEGGNAEAEAPLAALCERATAGAEPDALIEANFMLYCQ